MNRLFASCAIVLVWISSFAAHADTGKSAPSAVMQKSVIDEPVEPPSQGVVFAGFSARQDSAHGHAGVFHSFSGDLNGTGWIGKFYAGGGMYEYDTVGVPDGDVTGSGVQLAVQGGYQLKLAEKWVVGGMVGPVLHWGDLDEDDPNNHPLRTRVGGQVDGHLRGSFGPIDLEILGQYATIEHTVWTRTRLGYNTGFYTIKVGPEFSYFRTEYGNFDEYRVGGFIGFNLTRDLGITTALGYANYDSDNRDSGDSVYGSLGLSWTY